MREQGGGDDGAGLSFISRGRDGLDKETKAQDLKTMKLKEVVMAFSRLLILEDGNHGMDSTKRQRQLDLLPTKMKGQVMALTVPHVQRPQAH